MSANSMTNSVYAQSNSLAQKGKGIIDGSLAVVFPTRVLGSIPINDDWTTGFDFAGLDMIRIDWGATVNTIAQQ